MLATETQLGIPVDGLNFYKLLYENDEFCIDYGKAMLAASQLETTLKRLIHRHHPQEQISKATLGKLISLTQNHELLPTSTIDNLKAILKQRNYLTHNIHSLLSGLIEETILEGSDLLDSDVHTYTEKAWQLKNNIVALSEIVETTS